MQARSVWHIAAALSGASGVGAAAYGAHGLPKLIAADEAAALASAAKTGSAAPADSGAAAVPPPRELASPELREACFARANSQHMYHSLLMAAAPVVARRPAVVGGLALAGTLSFCGSVYAVALSGERARGIAAPAGGFCLIGAWLALLL